MSVSNGQDADETVFNSAFISKVSDSVMVSKLTLNRVASGAQIPDVQAKILDNASRIGVNEADIAILQASSLKNNFTAIAKPAATDDTTSGYSIGSLWLFGKILYIAIDVTASAAIWKRVNSMQYDPSISNVATVNISSSWVEILADSGASELVKLSILHDSGVVIEVGYGAATAEVVQFMIPAVGFDDLAVVPPNTRISVRKYTGEADVNGVKVTINGFKEV